MRTSTVMAVQLLAKTSSIYKDYEYERGRKSKSGTLYVGLDLNEGLKDWTGNIDNASKVVKG